MNQRSIISTFPLWDQINFMTRTLSVQGLWPQIHPRKLTKSPPLFAMVNVPSRDLDNRLITNLSTLSQFNLAFNPKYLLIICLQCHGAITLAKAYNHIHRTIPYKKITGMKQTFHKRFSMVQGAHRHFAAEVEAQLQDTGASNATAPTSDTFSRER